MTLNLDDALDGELPRYCGGCGTDLPERGAQCAACGWLPRDAACGAYGGPVGTGASGAD